jgi:hypothetical protein
VTRAELALLAWRGCRVMRQTEDAPAARMAMEQLRRLRELSDDPSIKRFVGRQLAAEVVAQGGFA